jgi:hypothetical protein
VSNDPPAVGRYLDDVVSLDTLTLTSDVVVPGDFDAVRAIAADPSAADRVVVAAADGLWMVDGGSAVLVQPGLNAGALAYTADGSRVVAAGSGSGAQDVTVLDAQGAVVTTVTADELTGTGAVDGVTIPNGAELTSLSPAPGADTAVVGFLDDTSDALAGVVVEIDAGAASPAITNAEATPAVVVARGPVSAVAV